MRKHTYYLIFLLILFIVVSLTISIFANYNEPFSDNSTTLITHIYNESYLLPFWLTHHKKMFDNIIIIDYNSTDNSVEICREICPDCKIITSRNETFDAVQVDKEVMDIENTVSGIKMCLNVTEFLFCNTPVKNVFENLNEPSTFSVKSYSPYSKIEYNVNSCSDLFRNLLNDDIVFHYDRGDRQIHTFSNGNYTTGRHETNNPSSSTLDNMFIIWLGYYPFNESLLERKLQIQKNMPLSDKQKRLGHQHLLTKQEMIDVLNNKTKDGQPLEKINSKLHKLIHNYKE